MIVFQFKKSSAGFSLVELAVAVALMLIVIGAVFTLIDPARARYPVQLEAADMEQRIRVASDVLSEDIAKAGAGPYAGAATGPLTYWFAPVLPYRLGAAGADPPGTFRSDTITLLYVPVTSAQSTLAAPVSSSQLSLQITSGPGCPVGPGLCGFTAGMTLLMFDSAGFYGTFNLVSTSGTTGRLSVNQPGGALSRPFAAGSSVVQVVQRTYTMKLDPTETFNQLVYEDGSSSTDVPVIDHLAGLTFEYYGDPQPPIATRLVSDAIGPWTTYGPKPPAFDARPTSYPAGENCVFTADASTSVHAPRLAVLGTGDSLAPMKLAAAAFTDGDAWCPDASAENRFDADLLRIRKIGVTIRIESALDALRGPAGLLFSRGGTARNADRLLPDHEVHFQVAPANLNLRP